MTKILLAKANPTSGYSLVIINKLVVYVLKIIFQSDDYNFFTFKTWLLVEIWNIGKLWGKNIYMWKYMMEAHMKYLIKSAIATVSNVWTKFK